MEGGTSVNAIPQSAWLEMEIRSESEDDLGALEPRVRAVLDRAVARENAGRRPGTDPLRAAVDSLGRRPGGQTPEGSPLVQSAVRATRALGLTPALVSSSTDANVPMAEGIPAVTLGAGGTIAAAHTTDESYHNAGGPDGLARAALTLLVLDALPASR